MKYEKSCGSLVYRIENEEIYLLLIRHKSGGHWSFPKGHVEKGETEIETALREVKEETNVSVRLKDGFREVVHYYPKPNIKKQVVYFIGDTDSDKVKRQEEEISEITWAPLGEAFNMVSFKNDKNLISKANAFLLEKGIISNSKIG